MFSGLIRWFRQHAIPAVSPEVSTFLAPLALDVESAGGAALTSIVHQAITEANTGHLSAGAMLNVGVEAGKKYLEENGVSDLEHAVLGTAAASIANLHMESVGASVKSASVQVHEAVTVPAEETEHTS